MRRLFSSQTIPNPHTTMLLKSLRSRVTTTKFFYLSSFIVTPIHNPKSFKAIAVPEKMKTTQNKKGRVLPLPLVFRSLKVYLRSRIQIVLQSLSTLSER